MSDRNSSRIPSRIHRDDESHRQSSRPDLLLFPSSAKAATEVAALTMDDIEDGIVASSTHDIYVSNILYLFFWV